ncbi:hypothetical protein BIW11_08671 [Tropilaelaps mercedesae]|uniref:Protein kinase domain-containing protein n=1 Tax=Tropilaelaps mercedesae TaxID=418985 RepID=A0A1V9XNI1_9ACAR|nr:hypothetical protein BIW11_08671 [Tropilaelaps mercedesae]
MDNSEASDLLNEGECLKTRWTIIRKIGGGGFGQIFEAWDKHDKQQVAIKVERRRAPKPVLRMEVTLLKRLQGCPHACVFFGCGRTEDINYIVMQIQGPNLSELRRAQDDQKFSASTALRLVYEALQCVEAVHSEGFLHRDIKPSNFAIGYTKETSRKVYILDFGLARQYLDEDEQLRPERSFVGFRGTTRYASLNAHRGKELGRHDDLISLFYMTVEFLTGKLPWRKVKEKDLVASMKKEFAPTQLLPSGYFELENIFYYLDGLRYHRKPDYDFIRKMLCRCIVSKGVRFEESFDWEENTRQGAPRGSEAGGESIRKNRKAKHKNRFESKPSYLGRQLNANDTELSHTGTDQLAKSEAEDEAQEENVVITKKIRTYDVTEQAVFGNVEE